MKRALLALIASAFVAITAGAGYTDDYDLKSKQGIERFWRDQAQKNHDSGA